MELYPNSPIQDLNLYFQRTMVYTKSKELGSEWDLLYIYEISKDAPGGSPYIYLWDGLKPAIKWPLKAIDIMVKFPTPGYYNWRGTVATVARKSRRQNRKGICLDTIDVTSPFVRSLSLKVPNPNFKLLDKYSIAPIYNDDGVSLREFLLYGDNITPIAEAWTKTNMVGGTILARAVGRRFALSKGVATSVPSVWFDDIYIGDMPSNNYLITKGVNGRLFFQETADFFVPQGIEVVTE